MPIFIIKFDDKLLQKLRKADPGERDEQIIEDALCDYADDMETPVEVKRIS